MLICGVLYYFLTVWSVVVCCKRVVWSEKQPVSELMQLIVSCSFPVKHTNLFGCSVSGFVSGPLAAAHNPVCPLCLTQRHSGGG